MNLNRSAASTFFLIFLILAIILFSGFFVNELQNVQSEKMNAWSEDARGDCAVVLTGGKGRVKEGLSLLSRKSVRKLIISGVYEKANLRDIFPEWPYYGDLNPDDVLLEKFSQTTYGNALQTYTLTEALKCKDLILITSQSHMYRAYKTFQNIFPKDYLIIKRAVVGSAYRADFLEEVEEASKSLFYSIWTY